MKTENAKYMKWMRRVSGLLATLLLTMSFAGQASAIILFQDDETHDIDSEGITINADDGGDEDVTLQFGNDGTDATITFDDGLSDLIYAGAGIDWSSVDMFRIREDADPAANAACANKGELIYDTTDDELQICTVVGAAGAATWASVDTGGATPDFEAVYGADADDTLTATNFDIDASGNLGFDADGSVTVGGAGVSVTSDGGTLALTGDGTNDIDVSNAGAAVDVDSATYTLDTTSSFSLDGGAASNVTTSAGALTLDGAGGVNIAGNASEVDVTTTGTLDLNSGAFTWDGSTAALTSTSTFDIDSTGAVTIDSDAATTLGGSTIGIDSDGGAVSINNNVNQDVNIGTGTSTGTVNVGGGAGSVSVNTTTWDISTAGVATGFTGITSTGVVDFSGASRLALHQGGANPGACSEGDIFYNTTDDTTYICTAANTWTGLSSGNPDFEAVYGTDADNTLTAVNFDIDASGNLGFDADGSVTVGGAGVSVTSDGGALALTGDGANDVDISNAGAAIDMDSATMTVDTTAGLSLDAGAASNLTTSAGALTLDGAGGVNIAGNAAEVDVTTTGAVDINSGAFTLDGSTVSIDGTDDSNFTITANDAADKTLTLSATNAGAGDGLVAVSSDIWSVTGAGVGSGFTGFTSTGTVNFSGTDEFRIREVADEAAADCTTVNEIVLDTTEDKIYVCTAAGSPGTWTSAADKVDTMVFEPEYPNYVLWGDGGNNRGTMKALYDSANGEHYYRWITKKRNQQHDYDIRFRYTLPDDYSGAGNMVLRLRNDTAAAADNALQVFTVRNDTDNQVCHADGSTTAAAANTWEDVTITGAEIETGCTGATALDPGDVVEVIMQLMADNANSGGTDVGTLSFDYTN